MAIKKSELYSNLWKSCDQLRGGMDASQYKDYILTLLFMRYVTDKYYGKADALIEVPEGGSFFDLVKLKGNKDIGDETNKVIRKMADANDLVGAITVADFNDADKLGKGKEMVDRLTNLISIFEDDAFDFRGNHADGDDLIGDAYEYLMRHFATESGKSKGQFYTPAEVSRIMAKVIGIDKAKSQDQTIYDPTCGSGSLLLKAADEAAQGVTIYGQEKDVATVGLAKMNMILHGNEVAEIKQGDTISSPEFKDKEGRLKTFDFAVANPPFSTKAWSNGITPTNDEFQRFRDYGIPPTKNGDYAFLLHLLKSLQNTKGKGAIILPHGVLFRGNAEADIRKNIIKRGYIKGIIGLPANLFYGTGIPAAIIVLDKENAAARKGIFMIDASKGFIKDGNKNRLREQDVHKIVDVFNKQLELPKYSKMVNIEEIEKNEYNLNIPRYIDNQEEEDIQDIEAHLLGGIPNRDIDALQKYWDVYPSLRKALFSEGNREGYSKLNVGKEGIKDTIFNHEEFVNYTKEISEIINHWCERHTPLLKNIDKGYDPKAIIFEISEDILKSFEGRTLVDKYDIYQYLMTYWLEVMKDDVYMVVENGWIADKDLVPEELIINKYFIEEKQAIVELEQEKDEITRLKEEFEEEHSGEEGALNSVSNKTEAQKTLLEYEELAWKEYYSDSYNQYRKMTKQLENIKVHQEELQKEEKIIKLRNNNGNVTKTAVKGRIKEIVGTTSQEYTILQNYMNNLEKIAALKKGIKELKEEFTEILENKVILDSEEEFIREIIVVREYLASLDKESELSKEIKESIKELNKKVHEKYKVLTVEEIKTLVVDDKWITSITSEVNGEMERISHRLTSRIKELAERYDETLPQLEEEVEKLTEKVEDHLKRMGFEW
ncbi:type I restriction-modification system subunit M [Clostridium formicaceticum]|uniref:site-specific DNA-methyltransferase (adenine-specific) n=1 Tax=Clostridium formicaceticum TaxID=1497 RepID=A0AAC9RP68_9CLOT|nr:type I restriction-modification system subunit M [Clostridium formicaceticum]AOY74699.1 type I restriction-modification system subunit M [Clostridium formicaceticum]ARE89077.1 Type I restriction enzyme EcoKI M protein [Clostridium formicaceticum]